MDEHEARTEASTPVQADARDYARTLRYAVEDDAEWAKKLAAKMTGSEAERAAIIVGATLSMALGVLRSE
jgi:DNA helicase HerA-like ATPase